MIEDVTILEAKLFALMAWADGTFHAEQRQVYLDFLEIGPATDQTKENLLRYLEDSPSEEAVLADLSAAPKEVVTTIVKVAYLIALANDDFHDEERQLLERIALNTGLEESQFPKFFKMLELHHSSYQIEEELFY